jgi:spermidine synthase
MELDGPIAFKNPWYLGEFVDLNREGPLKQRLLYLAVFTSGMSVMAVEMAASRLLAPFFGTSLIVWTCLIGIIMMALTGGYFLGGRLADRFPEARIFFRVQACAGALILAIPFVSDPVLSWTLGAQQIGVLVGSFLGVSLLLAVPIGILGVTSPFAIRLVSEDCETAGKAAGSIYALGTAGSILGTFLPGLLMIPSLGTKATILCFGSLVLVVALLGLGLRGGAGVALGGCLLLGAGLGPMKHLPGMVSGTESLYNYIQVMQREYANRPGKRTYLVLNEGRAVHSIYDPKAAQAPLVGGVWDFMNVVPALAYQGEPMKAAVIGLAAGTMPHQWISLFDSSWGVRVDGAEIDPGILEAGRKYFAIAKDEARGRLTVFQEDGRTFLRGRKPTSYDFILTDAYKQPYIPFHLATREYFQLVQSRLKDGGVMAINVGAISIKAEIFRRLLSTVSDVFGDVRYVLVKNSGVPFNNHVVLAFRGKPAWEKLDPKENPALQTLLKQGGHAMLPWIFRKSLNEFYRFNDYSKDLVFTDDRAPVEFYTEKMIYQYLAKGGPII